MFVEIVDAKTGALRGYVEFSVEDLRRMDLTSSAGPVSAHYYSEQTYKYKEQQLADRFTANALVCLSMPSMPSEQRVESAAKRTCTKQ